MAYVAEKYLDHTDPDAFLDWPAPKTESDLIKDYKLCPVCQGHGGWNLSLNAYPLHGRESTPENRHRYSHFRCCCSHCNGWGGVHKSVSCVGHEWKHIATTGRCLNLYECVHCGKIQEVDSSD